MNNLKGTTQKKILTKIHKTTTPHNPSAQLELNPSTSLRPLSIFYLIVAHFYTRATQKQKYGYAKKERLGNKDES